MDKNITLHFYKEDYADKLFAFDLPEDQLQFTALPIDALELAIADCNRFPVVIFAEGTPVGFFVLHQGAEISTYTSNSNAMLVRAFSVNHSHQGKGYAKEAMRLLPEFVRTHFPTVDEIVLAVNQRNVAAQKLYLGAGFEDLGLRKIGKIGLQYILQYQLR